MSPCLTFVQSVILHTYLLCTCCVLLTQGTLAGHLLHLSTLNESDKVPPVLKSPPPHTPTLLAAPPGVVRVTQPWESVHFHPRGNWSPPKWCLLVQPPSPWVVVAVGGGVHRGWQQNGAVAAVWGSGMGNG
jgi:hypothetical protein